MASTRITVKDNGSLKIEGDFEIVDKMAPSMVSEGGRSSLFAVVDSPRTSHSVTDPTKIISNTMPLLSICLPKKRTD